MTDTTEQENVQERKAPWPGFPVVPPCISDEVRFEGLDPNERADVWEIKRIYDATRDKHEPDPWVKHREDLYVRQIVESHAENFRRIAPAVYRRFHQPEKWEDLRRLYNNRCRYWGIAELNAEEFAALWGIRLERIHAIRDRAREADAPSNAGRKATEKTAHAGKIQAVLGVSDKRAYHILQHGTAVLEQRRKLAAAFADDPERNSPAHWDSGATWGRSVARHTFGDWVNTTDPTADASISYGPALGVVRSLLSFGVLTPHYPNAGAFVEGLLSNNAGVDMNQALALWSVYSKWQSDQT